MQMKTTILRALPLLLLLLPLRASAQMRFGFVKYAEVCCQMPQYEQAKKHIADLQAKYEQEAQRSETEFQRKFSEFLQGQKDFPANIMQKRQAELQDVMERGIAFRKEAEQLLTKAEKDLMQDVYNKLNAAITAVGKEQGYAFILNMDDNSAPYINPEMGDDVTDHVRVKLGILQSLPDHVTVTPVEVAPVETVTPAESPVGTAPQTETSPTEASDSTPA